MKQRCASMLGVALVMASSLAEGGSAPPSVEQKQALLQQAAAVGPQHERLADLAGNWEVTIALLMDPAHPVVEHGTSTYTRVLGGRHLRQDLRFGEKDKAFQGIGYLGYDNVSGRYFSSWMDTSFTGAMLAQGDYDTASATYTFHGGQADPTRQVDVVPVREVLHVIDHDHFSYEYFEVHDGTEAIAVRLEYTRAR